jgi:hypothetical protein
VVGQLGKLRFDGIGALRVVQVSDFGNGLFRKRDDAIFLNEFYRSSVIYL